VDISNYFFTISMRRNASSGDNDANNDADENARKRPMTLRRRDSTGRAETYRRRKRRAAWAEQERELDEHDADLFEVEGQAAVIPAPPPPAPPKDKEEVSSSSSSVSSSSSEFSDDYEEDDDDDEEVMTPVQPRPKFENRAIPLDRVELAARINMDIASQLCAVNEHLLGNPNYQHHLRRDKAMEIVGQNLGRISDLLKAVDDWVPITVPGDQPRAIPPRIPEADGSEMRFTNVAASMGIAWIAVPLADKMAVYERAAQLHVQHYGVRPAKVLMWTSEGYKPTAYYNKDTYERTMKRALEEYKGQK
jgi:hypothetical protein